MKKRFLACGLVPALVLGTCGTVGDSLPLMLQCSSGRTAHQLSRQMPRMSL